jgi:hypothetical protein
MGIINWFIQKSLINEARRIAKWARERYNSVKIENPNLNDTELYIRMLYDIDRFNNFKDDHKEYIKNCCQTIEGLCYKLAMDSENFKGFMVLRLVQFTKYMDHYLYSLGFKKQTKDQKESILKTLDIYLEDWEEIIK